MRRERTLWFLILCLFTAVGLPGQVVITSAVVGTVTDAQGAVVAGSTVTLTNIDTGVQASTPSSTSGRLSIS